jgi:hypothetical protein
MRGLTRLFLFIIILWLSACADDQAVRLGPKTWNDLKFVVETRPSPVRVGMNEFIVIASRGNVNPGYDLVVSLRVDEKVEWKQAIQDGYTGVYRRAIRINNPLSDILSVQIRQAKKDDEGNEAETILYFPLTQKQKD